MAESPLRLVKRCAEFQPLEFVTQLPKGRRGIYVLYRRRRLKGKRHYDVVYVGLATGSIRHRLGAHRRKKRDLWTHFSAYEVWDNIRDEEIRELEGLFRHLYRLDSRANELNVQRGFKRIRMVRCNTLAEWT